MADSGPNDASSKLSLTTRYFEEGMYACMYVLMYVCLYVLPVTTRHFEEGMYLGVY